MPEVDPEFVIPLSHRHHEENVAHSKKKNERKKHVAPGGPLPPHSPPLATSLGDYIYLLFILHFSITKENLKVQKKSSKNGTDQGG